MPSERGGRRGKRERQNLLFGLVAVQNNAVAIEAVLDASQQLTDQPEKRLEDVLVERGALSDDDRARVSQLCQSVSDSESPADVDATQTFAQGTTGIGTDQRQLELSTNEAETTAPTGASGSAVTEFFAAGQRYQRTRMHAQGGIGKVWLAHDQVLDRDVALKELRPERQQNQAIAERFIGEAKITGRLQHPAIVPVYELAVSDEQKQPFYTMRFFHGRTLREAVDEFHPRWQSGQAGELELRDLLQAFSTVANAVAYANSQGVIHRDLKGQNVVLGDFGEVIVLDWGIAKRVDDDDSESEDGQREQVNAPLSGESATLEGQVIGTPAFMAPEQAEGRIGDIDQRTDVYGLGAVLYQILTNRPPFAGTAGMSLLKQVIQKPPQPPREVCPKVPPALEAVCLKALSKDPAARYPNATAMMDDVRRYVADEPVGVYREPLLARCGRWGRRHRTAVASTAALLVTAVIALSTSTWLIAREQERTENQRQFAVESASRAETSYNRALDAVDTMLTTVADERLRDVPHMETIRRDLLQEALRLNQEILEQQPDDLRGQTEVAHANARIGKLYRNMGDLALSLERYEEANTLYSQLVDRDASVALSLARSLLSMANVYYLDSRYDESEATSQRALNIIDGRLADHAGDAELLVAQAEAYQQLASTMMAASRVSDSESHYRDALTSLQSLPPGGPLAERALELTATSHTGLATLCSRTGRGDEAEANYVLARDSYQTLVEQAPTNGNYKWRLASCHRGLAQLLTTKGELEQAEQVYLAALDLRSQLARDFSHMPEYRSEYATTLNDMGVHHARSGEMQEAESFFRQALAEDTGSVAEFPKISWLRQNLGYDYNNLGTLLLQTGRMQESADMHQSALQTRQALAADYPQERHFRAEVAASHNNVGILYHRLEQPEQAAEQYAEAIRIRKSLVEDFPDETLYRHHLAETHRVLGSLLTKEERFEDALVELNLARQIYEQLPEGMVGVAQSHWRMAETHQMMADVYAKTDRNEEATVSYRRALEIREDILRDHAERADYQIETAVNHMVLGNHLRTVEQLAEAEAELQRSLQVLAGLADRMEGNPHVEKVRSDMVRGLARVAFDRDDWTAADDEINRALPLIQSAVEAAPENEEFRRSLRRTRYWEARIAISLGNLDEAVLIADALPADEPDQDQAWYDAARLHAYCLAAVQSDTERSADQRDAAVDLHTNRALEMLRQARSLDPDLEIDQADFQSLFDHPDFPSL